MEMALVENIQREDLNAIEIALAYEHLLEKSGMTQEKVAERVGLPSPIILDFSSYPHSCRCLYRRKR